MAKQKTPTVPPVSPGVERLSVLNLKGSPAYRDWLASLSEASLIPVTNIVRDALERWAEGRGYPKPPKV